MYTPNSLRSLHHFAACFKAVRFETGQLVSRRLIDKQLRGGIVNGRMTSTSNPPRRRAIVVVVPPVNELDLVGPFQVCSTLSIGSRARPSAWSST